MNLLLDNIEMLANSAFNAAKLKELILQLAVQGKLVEQNPKDEPASKLLEKIKAEKAKLIKEGKLKKEAPLPPITKEEMPFPLPDSWAWCKLGEIVQHNSGKTLDSARNKGNPQKYITTSNLYWGFFIKENLKTILVQDSELDRCTAIKGDLLICEGGEAGRAAIWDSDIDICFQNHIHRVRPYCKISSEYIYRYFYQLYLSGEINNYRKGVGISNLSGKSLSSVIFPLPPIAEQHRIVARVESLFAKVDELTKLINIAEKNTAAFGKSILNELVNADTAKEIKQSWQNTEANFNKLFSSQQNVKELRKTCLQLAVQGKLTKQNPEDEPASKLLEKIKAEKAKLIKEGKLKKETPLPAISMEDIPYQLPDGWEWCRLYEITSMITDGEHQTPPRITFGEKLISAKNVRDGYIDFENCDRISTESYNKCIRRYKPEKDDLLIVSVGGTIGRTSLVSDINDFALVRSVAVIRPSMISSNYLRIVINSPLLQSEISRKKRGGAQPCLYLGEINSFIFPLAPTKVQLRIVAKVEKLMALCDKLEEQIIKQKELHQKLMQTVVRDAVAPKKDEVMELDMAAEPEGKYNH
jgi:type I restriction enzyme, S subunit